MLSQEGNFSSFSLQKNITLPLVDSLNNLPIRFKGFILLSIIQVKNKKQKAHLKHAFYYWYVNRNLRAHQNVLFNMLTKNMSSMAFFYKIKNYAKKQNQKSISILKKMEYSIPKKCQKQNSQPKVNKTAKESIPCQKNQNQKFREVIQQKRSLFAQQFIERILSQQQKRSQQSIQGDTSSLLQLVSLKIINQKEKQQKQDNDLNFNRKFNKSQKKHLTEYFQSLKDIFSIKLEYNNKNVLLNQYKKKRICTQGQHNFNQIDTSEISSFQCRKKSLSFCPSFSSSVKDIKLVREESLKTQNNMLIQKGYQIGTKFGLILTNSVISSIQSKQKSFFFNLLLYFIQRQAKIENVKIPQIRLFPSSSTISLYDQNEYDQRIDLIRRNIQLLEIDEQKQKQIFLLYKQLQVHHQELMQIEQQFNKLQINLKHNFFIMLDRTINKYLKQAFRRIKKHTINMTVLSTFKHLLQDSDAFDQFPKINGSGSSEQKINCIVQSQRIAQNNTQKQLSNENDITSIKLDEKISEVDNLSNFQIKIQSQQELLKNSSTLSHFKRPSINYVGTQRELHRVYTLSSLNSQKSSPSQKQYSSKLLFQQSIKQLNQLEETNNSSQFFSKNCKVNE